MKDDQGRYYTFGFFREDGGWNDSYEGPVVRKDWLDECGLEVPKTISEFENVIRVFNEKYGATLIVLLHVSMIWVFVAHLEHTPVSRLIQTTAIMYMMAR